MGKETQKQAQNSPFFEVMGGIDSSCSPKFYDNLLPNCSVLIDFSLANALPITLEKAIKYRVPLVIGTTAHNKSNLAAIKEASKHIPIFFSPNFSMGIAFIKKIIARLETSFPNHSITIEETHCKEKKDSPSGTAIDLEKEFKKDIPITSYREKDAIATHVIIISNNDEQLLISHKALSRALFAKGALEKAKEISLKSKGLYL